MKIKGSTIVSVGIGSTLSNFISLTHDKAVTMTIEDWTVILLIFLLAWIFGETKD